ncbi:MAG: hypothetical protein EBU08_11510 [Micrococcales bacterium]|nr:hypothetical protein [Micrococcales bacterium]
MITQGQVGALATAQSLAAGSQTITRLGNMGDAIVSELHGRYYETVYRRAGFVASNPTPVTTVAVTSGTTTSGLTGIFLTNPVNSPVNLVLNKVGFSVTVAPAAVMPIMLGVGYNSATAVTQTTALTVRNAYVGVGSSGYGLAASVVTVPTAPNFTHILGTVFTTLSTNVPTIVDLEGSVILPPGGYAGIMSTVASGASGFFGSISWEEVPL